MMYISYTLILMILSDQSHGCAFIAFNYVQMTVLTNLCCNNDAACSFFLPHASQVVVVLFSLKGDVHALLRRGGARLTNNRHTYRYDRILLSRIYLVSIIYTPACSLCYFIMRFVGSNSACRFCRLSSGNNRHGWHLCSQ